MAVPAISMIVTLQDEVVWTIERALRVWDVILRFIELFYENRKIPPEAQAAAAVLRYGVTESAKSMELIRTRQGMPGRVITDPQILLRIKTLARVYFVGLVDWTRGSWLDLEPVELPVLT